MKTTIIIFLISVFFMPNTIISQINSGKLIKLEYDKDFIYHTISELNNAIIEDDIDKINKILDDNYHMEENHFQNPFDLLDIQPINIIKESSNARVICIIKFRNNNLIDKFILDTIYLEKNRNQWKITELGTLEGKVKNLYNNKFIPKSKIKSINVIEPIISYNTGILEAHYLSPEIMEINGNITQNYTTKLLFGLYSKIDIALYATESNNTTNYAIFNLDDKWKRVLFSKLGSDEIKCYSCAQNEVKFFDPVAIDVNEFGEVFILDRYTKQIHKFIYNINANSLMYQGLLDIPVQLLRYPEDLDYSSNETADYPQDDFILVTDRLRKSILKFSREGILIKEYTTYIYNGTVYNIDWPTRISSNWSTQFIDKGSNYIISCEILPSTIVCYNISKLPYIYNPTDIALDASYNILVTDESGLVHKFSFYGEYICSYKIADFPFHSTQRIGNTLLTNPNFGILTHFVNDLWTQSKGSKRILPGADAIELEITDNGSYYRAKCKFTDKCYYKFEIIKMADGSVLYTKNSSTNIGGEINQILIPTNQFSAGTYIFRVSFLPFYNSSYGNYSVDWKIKELLFTPLIAPVISNFTQSPNPICKGTTGYVYVNLSQGNGNLTYNWFSYNAPSGVTVNFSPNSNRCTITYSSADAVALGAEGPTWDFGCTVSNSVGESTMRYTPILSDCNGCPTLSFEQNGMLFDENPLLITSLRNPGKDVIDYYLINTPITPVNNKIKLTVHEPQTEHSWFDQISLIEATANQGENIVVNEQGQVINYSSTIPLRIMLNGQTDITSALGNMDSVTVQLNVGDVITITRFTEGVEADGDVVLGGVEPPPPQKRLSALRMNLRKEITNEQGEQITEVIPITEFFLRPNKSIISKRITNLPSGVIELQVNKPLELDYFAFVINLQTVKTKTLSLSSAVHSVNGEIKGKLISLDGNYGELSPTERIDLTFNTTTTTGNRAYILKTAGRYVTDSLYLKGINKPMTTESSKEIPTEYKLFDNYPNPFNPTTVIRWQSPVGSHTTLKVYDILGNEAATLVDEYREAGRYKVEFDASKLASGVYIYKLTAGSFTSSKKMMVIK
ncbi:T9SS type A sorting domain-containing protein [Ignavibacterium sp.]|uniref:T9SS type A sorting domain-containing protein n=1 Tax=Ignavibacterium sp. TaxID=2651167 RepID=UPI002206B318|nr:T9SS type A sorting domain-containing protein [Ignavibacterium sp.]BDQ02275.1 MAG: hypothetical protein KatS3mg037_0850 [Ignavibacterium sp.]